MWFWIVLVNGDILLQDYPNALNFELSLVLFGFHTSRFLLVSAFHKLSHSYGMWCYFSVSCHFDFLYL